MYKVIIAANDEETIGMTEQIIQQEYKDMEIVEYCNSGLEVLQYLEKKTADILFITVSLNELNGLETVRKIRQRDNGSGIQICVLASNEALEVLSEMIQLGIEGYLTKPFWRVDLIKNLTSITNKIDMKREKLERVKVEKELLEKRMQLSNYGFVFNILFNSQCSEEFQQNLRILGLKEYGYVLNIEIVEGIKYRIDPEKEYEVIYRYLDDMLKDDIAIVGANIANRIIIISCLDITEIEKGKEISKSVANIIKSGLLEEFGLKTSIGIGKIHQLKHIHTSYEEAILALRYQMKENIVYAGEVTQKGIKHGDYMELEAEMLDNIKFGKKGTLSTFASILDMLRPLTDKEKRNKVLEILILACRATRLEGQNEMEYMNYAKCIYEMDRFEEVETWAFSKFEYIIKAVRTSRSARKSKTVQDALGYIENHFEEEISLKDVADYVGVTPQHFSKIFKEEIGENYVDWLTNLRMDKAKKYLNTGDKNIKEICYMVGYKDPNYFSRIFKKIVGMSPTEYVKVDR